ALHFILVPKHLNRLNTHHVKLFDTLTTRCSNDSTLRNLPLTRKFKELCLIFVAHLHANNILSHLTLSTVIFGTCAGIYTQRVRYTKREQQITHILSQTLRERRVGYIKSSTSSTNSAICVKQTTYKRPALINRCVQILLWNTTVW